MKIIVFCSLFFVFLAGFKRRATSQNRWHFVNGRHKFAIGPKKYCVNQQQQPPHSQGIIIDSHATIGKFSFLLFLFAFFLRKLFNLMLMLENNLKIYYIIIGRKSAAKKTVNGENFKLF
jgi:hypothetical protein